MFVDFRPHKNLDGVPEGFVVLLLHKLLVAVFIGAFKGPTLPEQRAQTLCLVIIFVAVAIWIAVSQPFLVGRVNIAEAAVALIQAAAVFMNLWLVRILAEHFRIKMSGSTFHSHGIGTHACGVL